MSSLLGTRFRTTRAFVAYVPLVCAIAACGGGQVPAPAPVSPPPSEVTPPVSVAATAGVAEDASATGAVTQVACGDFHTCALLKDGTLKCWGRNKGGQVGAGKPDEQHDPIAVPGIAGAKQIATGATFSCALLADASVKCWGSGRLTGDGKFKENVPPTPVQGIADAKSITAGGYLACALLGSGKVKCWGLDGTKGRPPDVGDVVEVRAAGAHACALTKTGAAKCWGEAGFVPGGVPVADVRQIVTGDAFACALTKDGKVKCWGSNDEGQLGAEPDMDLHKTVIDVAGLEPAVRIAAGQTQACALSKEGRVRCWGSNSQGELGVGKQSTDERAGEVKGISGVADVCAASMHACARTEAGGLYCWGGNVAGQVGDGTEERRLAPTRIKL